MVDSGEIDRFLEERIGLVEMLDAEAVSFLKSLLNDVFSKPFNANRDNFFDKQSLVDCALEIISFGVRDEKKAISMCHKIQNNLANSEVRQGWRVSFGCEGNSHRFYYLNDRRQERRIISFHCQVLKNSPHSISQRTRCPKKT